MDKRLSEEARRTINRYGEVGKGTTTEDETAGNIRGLVSKAPFVLFLLFAGRERCVLLRPLSTKPVVFILEPRQPGVAPLYNSSTEN